MAVLYLDADDEITSAASRIRATDDDRIAVVLPFGSRLATSRINFKLLAREATQQGKSIEIVAADASARALALTAGLTVHPSVAAFEDGPDGSPGGVSAAGEAVTARSAGASSNARPVSGEVVVVPPSVAPTRDDEAPTSVILIPRSGREPVPIVGRVKPPIRPRVAVGLVAAVLLALLVAGVAAFTLLPAATIVLSPWSQAIGPLQVSVVADPNATAADPTTLTVPAQRFTYPVSVQKTFQASGVKVTEVKATGTVQFANFDTGRGVLIPSGTTVRTESKIEFTTTADLTLPRATFDFFPPFTVHPSTGTVGIQAADAGTSGNVGANTITVIPKARNTLQVTNPDPTSGGAHNESTVISQTDVDNALASLNAALPGALDQQIATASNVPSGTTLYPQTKQLGTGTPTVDPKTLVGQEQTSFDLGLDAQGTVLGIDSSPVQGLAAERLRSKVQADWTLDPASVSIEVGTPTIVGQVVSFPVSMSGRQVRTVNQAALLAEIEGLDAPAARSRLDDYGSADIRLWPDWVTTIPSNASRVTLTIGDPAPMPSPAP